MKIESIIRRKGGTVVTLGGATYEFKPDESGRHVAEIDNIEHLGRLLDIKEGYRVAEGEAPLPAQKLNTEKTDTNTLAPVHNPDAGNPVKDESEGEQDSKQADETADEGQQEGEQVEGEAGDDEEPQELDREALAVQFEEKFGRRPHNRWSAERIQQELQGE